MNNTKIRHTAMIKIISMVLVCLFLINNISDTLPAQVISVNKNTLAVQSQFSALINEGIDLSFQTRFEILAGVKLLMAGKTYSAVNGMLIEKHGEGIEHGESNIEFLPGVERDPEGKNIKAKFIVKGRENVVFEIKYTGDETMIKPVTSEKVNSMIGNSQKPVKGVLEEVSDLVAGEDILPKTVPESDIKKIRKFLQRDLVYYFLKMENETNQRRREKRRHKFLEKARKVNEYLYDLLSRIDLEEEYDMGYDQVRYMIGALSHEHLIDNGINIFLYPDISQSGGKKKIIGLMPYKITDIRKYNKDDDSVQVVKMKRLIRGFGANYFVAYYPEKGKYVYVVDNIKLITDFISKYLKGIRFEDANLLKKMIRKVILGIAKNIYENVVYRVLIKPILFRIGKAGVDQRLQEIVEHHEKIRWSRNSIVGRLGTVLDKVEEKELKDCSDEELEEKYEASIILHEIDHYRFNCKKRVLSEAAQYNLDELNDPQDMGVKDEALAELTTIALGPIPYWNIYELLRDVYSRGKNSPTRIRSQKIFNLMSGHLGLGIEIPEITSDENMGDSEANREKAKQIVEMLFERQEEEIRAAARWAYYELAKDFNPDPIDGGVIGEVLRGSRFSLEVREKERVLSEQFRREEVLKTGYDLITYGEPVVEGIVKGELGGFYDKWKVLDVGEIAVVAENCKISSEDPKYFARASGMVILGKNAEAEAIAKKYGIPSFIIKDPGVIDSFRSRIKNGLLTELILQVKDGKAFLYRDNREMDKGSDQRTYLMGQIEGKGVKVDEELSFSEKDLESLLNVLELLPDEHVQSLERIRSFENFPSILRKLFQFKTDKIIAAGMVVAGQKKSLFLEGRRFSPQDFMHENLHRLINDKAIPFLRDLNKIFTKRGSVFERITKKYAVPFSFTLMALLLFFLRVAEYVPEGSKNIFITAVLSLNIVFIISGHFVAKAMFKPYKMSQEDMLDFVTLYGAASVVDHEDMCEFYASYVLQGDILRRLAEINPEMAKKYEFFRDKIFNGREYTRDSQADVVILKDVPHEKKEENPEDDNVDEHKSISEKRSDLTVESVNKLIDREYEEGGLKVLPERLDIKPRELFEFRGGEVFLKRGDGIALLAGAPFTGKLSDNLEAISSGLRKIEPDPGKLYILGRERQHMSIEALVKNTAWISSSEDIERKRNERIKKAKELIPGHGKIKVRFHYKDISIDNSGNIIALGYVDNTELFALRHDVRDKGISAKPSNIVHSTIGRIFDEEINEGKIREYLEYLKELRSRKNPDGSDMLIGQMTIDEVKIWDQRPDDDRARMGGAQGAVQLRTDQAHDMDVSQESEVTKITKKIELPIDITRAVEGLEAFQRLIEDLPDELAKKLPFIGVYPYDLLLVFTGICAESICLQAGDFWETNGILTQLSKQEKDILISAIKKNNNILIVNKKRNWHLINLKAASRVMEKNPMYFPEEARKDPGSWLVNNYNGWYAKKSIAEIRYGLLSGYPRGSVERFVEAKVNGSIKLGRGHRKSHIYFSFNSYDEDDDLWIEAQERIFYEAARIVANKGIFTVKTIEFILSSTLLDFPFFPQEIERKEWQEERYRERYAKSKNWRTSIREYLEFLVGKKRDILFVPSEEIYNLPETKEKIVRDHQRRVEAIALRIGKEIREVSWPGMSILRCASAGHDTANDVSYKFLTDIRSMGMSASDAATRTYEDFLEYARKQKGEELTEIEKKELTIIHRHGIDFAETLKTVYDLPPEVEILIRGHVNYLRFLDDIEKRKDELSLSKEELNLLYSILVIADRIESLSNREKRESRGLDLCSFDQIVESIERSFKEWGIEDTDKNGIKKPEVRPCEVLKDLLAKRDRDLFEIIRDARGELPLKVEEELLSDKHMTEFAHKVLYDEVGPEEISNWFQKPYFRGYSDVLKEKVLVRVVRRIMSFSKRTVRRYPSVEKVIQESLNIGDLREHVPEVLRGKNFGEGEDGAIFIEKWELKDGEKLDGMEAILSNIKPRDREEPEDREIVLDAIKEALTAYFKDYGDPDKKRACLEAFYRFARGDEESLGKILQIRELDHKSLMFLEQCFKDIDGYGVLMKVPLHEIPETEWPRVATEEEQVNPKIKVKALTRSLTGIWKNKDTSERELVVNKSLRGVTNEVIREKILPGIKDPELQGYIEEHIKEGRSRTLSRNEIVKELFSGIYNIIEKEKRKFVYVKTDRKITLEFRAVKGIFHILWGYIAGLCVRNDYVLWKKENFFLLEIFDRGSKRIAGYVHLYEETINGEKVLFVPGVEPTTEFLSEVKAKDFYPVFERAILRLKAAGGYKRVYIPVASEAAGEIASERTHILSLLKKKYKNAEIIKLPSKVEWTGDERHHFEYVWEIKNRNILSVPSKEIYNLPETKQVFVREHMRRVTEIALRIGKEMGLSENNMNILRCAACGHDVSGWISSDYVDFGAMGIDIKEVGRKSLEEFLLYAEGQKGDELSPGEREKLIKVYNHGITYAEILKSKYELSPEVEILIRGHAYYDRFLSDFERMQDEISISREDLNLLFSILVIADVVESGSNKGKRAQRGRETGTFDGIIDYLEKKFEKWGLENPRKSRVSCPDVSPLEVLKNLLVKRDKDLLEIIRDARGAKSIDSILKEEDEMFLLKLEQDIVRKERLTLGHLNDENYLLINASRYLKSPVNMHIDLRSVPTEEGQLEENMETLARLIAWHDSYGLDVRYILNHDADGSALRILKGKLKELGELPGLNADELLARVGPPHTGDEVIDIKLESMVNLEKNRRISDREYIVALKDDGSAGISIPNYTAASVMGLSLAALRIAKEKLEEHPEDQKEYELFRGKVLDKFRDIYERFGVIREKKDFSEDELEMMVTGSSNTKLYYTFLYALPPVVKVIEEIFKYHEMMQDLLQAA